MCAQCFSKMDYGPEAYGTALASHITSHIMGWCPLFFFFGLHCCVQAFSSYGERGLLFVVVCELLIVVASLVAEHGL